MSKHLKITNYLKNITDIEEEFSENDEQETFVMEKNMEIDQELFSSELESENDSEEENIINKRSGQKKKRVLLSSESEIDLEDQRIETAADGTVWEEIDGRPNLGRLPVHKCFRDMSGPTGYAKRHIMKGQMKTAFSLIIDQHITRHIIKCTEEEAFRVLGTKWELNATKLDAFISLLYARGAYEARNLDISYLWNKNWGPAFFSKTMSRNDFTEIMKYIRFDKKSERSQRLQTDKFSMISTIWDRFIENSQNCYKPGAYIAVDEQLFPSKTRCRFTQYMPNKPDKFGIKFWLACDVKSKYIINGFPYLGKDERRDCSIPLGEFVVLKLMDPFTGCGRTVTTDNFFTSVSLAKKLLARKTTIVGTIRGNKRELPKLAKEKKDKMVRFSSKFYKSNYITLTVYKSKPKKKVLVLSSKHNSIEIEKSSKRIPETIRFYNSTKFGVDVADQMARKYSVKSKSCRWPLQVFFNILDLAGINAWILYKETTGENISRQEFLFQLASELGDAYTKSKEKQLLPTPSTSTDLCVRKTCQIKFCKGYKTTKICSKCEKYVCGKCTFQTKLICKQCEGAK